MAAPEVNHETVAATATGDAVAELTAVALVTLQTAAKMVTKLKMYPYFDIANYALMCMMVREDDRPTADGQVLSRRHPLASWISSMLMCFSSVLLVNLILGEPLVTPFTNHRDMLTASAVWYAINYSPFDIIYKLSKFTPFKVIIYSMKEIQRASKVHHGVHLASKLYPHAYVIICVVGVLKGAGYYYMRIVERLVRGTWIPTSNEILQPTLATKACLIASLLFIFDEAGLIDLPHQQLYLAIVAFFILGRLAYLLFHIHNPFLLFEKIVGAVFFGGILDAIRRRFAARWNRSPAAATSKTDGDSANGQSAGGSSAAGAAHGHSATGASGGGAQGGKKKEE